MPGITTGGAKAKKTEVQIFQKELQL